MNCRKPWLRLLSLGCLLILAAASAVPPAANASIITASISPDYEAGPAPLTVYFHAFAYDDIEMSVSYYSWSFGDGIGYGTGWHNGYYDTAESVSHTYTNPGGYNVYVTACNSVGHCQSDDAYVWVQEP